MKNPVNRRASMAGIGKPKYVAGWVEYIDLPDWNIHGVKAKIDTGARSSALHVEDIEVLAGRRVQFHVMLGRKKLRRVKMTAKILKKAKVRSSTGLYRTRYFITTRIKLGDVVKEIELSLVSREKMLFRMLLGRKALGGDFMVDPGRRLTFGRPPKQLRQADAKESREAEENA